MIFCFNLLVVPLVFSSVTTKPDVTFYLAMNENNTYYINIGPNNASEYIKNDSMVVFLIHGWRGSRKVKWYPSLTKAFFSHSTPYVVQVDYEKIAARVIYPVPVLQVPLVGRRIVDLIVSLTKSGISPEKIHIVGHSLGGQVAGFVGRDFHKRMSIKIGRITGLDPAGPLFEAPFNVTRHLNRKDAIIVLVIHTDGGHAGYLNRTGLIDVFPNGGTERQPGCLPIVCSHGRSVSYYIDALEFPGTLLAAKCGKYHDLLDGRCNNTRIIDIGGDITVDDEGSFYMTTTGYSPFRSLIPSK